MREIVHVQLGGVGNDIGTKFWEELAKEHNLDEYGVYPKGRYCAAGNIDELQYINVFFTEVEGRKKYVPRAVLADFDPRTFLWKKRYLFNPDNIVVGRSGTGNNWAKGYYNERKDFADLILDRVRREAEACDLMQGIQVVHSLSGGTGSGTGSYLVQNMRDEYPRKILKNYTWMPLSEPFFSQLSLYNAVLSMSSLIDYVDEVVCFDVNSLYTYPYNINVPYCMLGITACLRFPGQLNTDLRKLKTNLVPFPQLHFFVPAYVPQKIGKYERLSVQELTQQMFDTRNMFVKCDLNEGKLLAATAIFRGNISPMDVNNEMLNIQRNRQYFIDCIPHNVQIAVCQEKICDIKMCATSLFNTTAFRKPLKQLRQIFFDKLKKKYYLHFYLEEGMTEAQFLKADEKLVSLINKYESIQKNMF